MPDQANAEFQNKIRAWQQAGGFAKGHGGAMAEDDSFTGQALGAAGGAIEGLVKTVGSFIDPKTKFTEGSPDYYDPRTYGAKKGWSLRDWAASSDPQHPMSESVGRFAGEMIPATLTPELPLLAGANALKMMGPILRHPKAAEWAMKQVQDLWKGTVGGAEQNWDDHTQGAATGATTTIGQKVVGAIPWDQAAHGTGMAGAALSHGHRFAPFWLLYHLGRPLAAIAKQAAAVHPGVAGAAGERLRQTLDDQNQ